MVPEFFTGIREPWKGVLLFGPPGTGKTMLAKAASAVNGSTFFNVSASLLVSKFGESEKIVRCLFNMARFYGPIVFIDEIDAIASSRGANEHEASRRLKTEIFTQMDGITSGVGLARRRAAVVARSWCWRPPTAGPRRRDRRRLESACTCRCRTPSRNDIFAINLSGMRLAGDVRVLDLADRTDGYSGADINLVCREASMMPMRRLIMDKNPEEIQAMHSQGLLQAPTVYMDDFAEVSSNPPRKNTVTSPLFLGTLLYSFDSSASKILTSLSSTSLFFVNIFVQAIRNTRPSVGKADLSQFDAWNAAFGSR